MDWAIYMLIGSSDTDLLDLVLDCCWILGGEHKHFFCFWWNKIVLNVWCLNAQTVISNFVLMDFPPNSLDLWIMGLCEHVASNMLPRWLGKNGIKEKNAYSGWMLIGVWYEMHLWFILWEKNKKMYGCCDWWKLIYGVFIFLYVENRWSLPD